MCHTDAVLCFKVEQTLCVCIPHICISFVSVILANVYSCIPEINKQRNHSLSCVASTKNFVCNDKFFPWYKYLYIFWAIAFFHSAKLVLFNVVCIMCFWLSKLSKNRVLRGLYTVKMYVVLLKYFCYKNLTFKRDLKRMQQNSFMKYTLFCSLFNSCLDSCN